MKDHTQPLLTIGIIFKNEIRCLRRCLDALAPLREAVSCELIMADTGSTDGSREVAAQFADILFDFPWINDFSAARNAVMDRATGQWYLTVDTDEYLDSNISELVDFLKSSAKYPELICGVIQRNYDTIDMNSKYSDFLAVRLVRMSTGLRYQGSIHEAWFFEEKGIKKMRALSHTVLHHDGYVDMDGEGGRAKRERNLSLLRNQLAQEPENLKFLMQYIESGRREEDYWEVLKNAAKEIEAQAPGWQLFGPPILRYAAKAALEEEAPDFWNWISQTEKLFPDSHFTRVDVEYIAFTQSLKENDYVTAIRRGERCLNSIKELRKDKEFLAKVLFSTLLLFSPYWEQGLKIYLADIYIKGGNPGRAQELLQDIDGSLLDEQQTGNLLCVLGDLQRLSHLDTSSLMLNLIQGIKKSVPSEEAAQKREAIFFETAALAFLSQTQRDERQQMNFCRPSYTLFLPLGTESEFGIAAMILETKDKERIHQLLLSVKDWERLPVEALAHALTCDITFPLPEKILTIEEIDHLIGRLAEDREAFFYTVGHITNRDTTAQNVIVQNINKNLQQLTWEQRLILTAMRIYKWDTDDKSQEDIPIPSHTKNILNKADEGLNLARHFAKIENEALPRYYTSEVLCAGNLSLLPALHRFGWYCAKAFEALDSGNLSVYVRELKSGLNVCPEAKVIVEYLLKYTPLLRISQEEVSKELLALAEQVKSLLAAYPADHPAVAAIKESPAYQKVAKLIEGNAS